MTPSSDFPPDTGASSFSRLHCHPEGLPEQAEGSQGQRKRDRQDRKCSLPNHDVIPQHQTSGRCNALDVRSLGVWKAPVSTVASEDVTWTWSIAECLAGM